MTMQDDINEVSLDTQTALWVGEYKRLKQQIGELTEALDVARAHIESAMGDATVASINGLPAVRWSTVTSVRLDTTQMKKTIAPELLAPFQTTTVSRRFEVLKDSDL